MTLLYNTKQEFFEWFVTFRSQKLHTMMNCLQISISSWGTQKYYYVLGEKAQQAKRKWGKNSK